MNQYAVTALQAVDFYGKHEGYSIKEAWERTAIVIFGNTPAAKKGCPKGAFLGLCEEGYVKGVPKGNYTNSKKNKQYAIKAVQLLQLDPLLVYDKKRLWKEVTHEQVSYNDQMDVVIVLWKNGLIIARPPQ